MEINIFIARQTVKRRAEENGGKPLLAQFQALEKFGIEILKMIHLNNQQKMNSRMRMADALDPTLIFLVIWLARHSGHHPL